MEKSGFVLKQCLNWIKNQFVIGRQDYHWRHEPILYGWKPGVAHKWYGKRDKGTVVEEIKEPLIITRDNGDIDLFFNIGLQEVVIRVPSYKVVYNNNDELTTTWRCPKPLKSEDHPTQKPVAIIEMALKNSPKRNEIVLDLFGGSGSTMIACEKTNRKCFMMEIDPRYCDIILKRWEEYTGKNAEIVR